MLTYPKIETLYDRDEKTFKVIPGKLRMPEFGLVREWFVTEKIDGTNVRIGLDASGKVTIGGRTDNAQVPTFLMSYLHETFTQETMNRVFEDRGDAEVVLFGEGYGEKIQKGGGDYRKGVSLRVFDVKVGDLWLEMDDVEDVAHQLGIDTVPFVGIMHTLPQTAQELDVCSIVSEEDGGTARPIEGFVARTVPLLLTRRGERVMWKLKFRDFV